MHLSAPHRAQIKGRPRPSFFHGAVWGVGLLLLSQPPVLAQTAGAAAAPVQPVYRCGQVYTNAPADPSACTRLPLPALTTIEGTRTWPQAPAARAQVHAARSQPLAEPVRPDGAPLPQREQQARSILLGELEKARQQLGELQQEYNQGEPEKWASESRHHQKYLDRVAALKAAIERTGRDIDSLQRELARQSTP